ncbi:MAG: class I SAM-dependent methyltransferase [Desulfobulbaceae bacterium]
MKRGSSPPASTIGVYYTDAAEKKRARRIAAELSLPLTTDPSAFDLFLGWQDAMLTLFMRDTSPKPVGVSVDFVGGHTGYRRKHPRRELLLKAVGFRAAAPPFVLDATGGLGRDAFLMAERGCRVHIIERNPIVGYLLADGLRRAAGHPETRTAAGRIELSIRDSRMFLTAERNSAEKYQVIYLDPMYPTRRKTALAGKEMRLLQRLLGKNEDADQLLAAALQTGVERVVVKRPKRSQFLGDTMPSHSITGSTTRFDIYLIPRMERKD